MSEKNLEKSEKVRKKFEAEGGSKTKYTGGGWVGIRKNKKGCIVSSITVKQ